MQKRYALRNIAIALVLSHKERCKRVKHFNEMIDAQAAGYRSPSSLDGMPHAPGVGDPVGAAVVASETIVQQRDAEQARIDAVEWALRFVCDFQREEDEQYIRAALLSYYEDRDHANMIIDMNTKISQQTFIVIKRQFINQILKYLYLK